MSFQEHLRQTFPFLCTKHFLLISSGYRPITDSPIQSPPLSKYVSHNVTAVHINRIHPGVFVTVSGLDNINCEFYVDHEGSECLCTQNRIYYTHRGDKCWKNWNIWSHPQRMNIDLNLGASAWCWGWLLDNIEECEFFHHNQHEGLECLWNFLSFHGRVIILSKQK